MMHRRFRVRRSALTLAGLMTLFLLYWLISYSWTPSEVYARDKLLSLWGLTFWPFLACAFIISRSRERLERFAAALVLFSLWILSEVLLVYSSTGIRGASDIALGASYLGLGRVFGAAALILLMYGLMIETHRRLRWAALLLFACHVFIMLILGARGPFLSMCLAILVPFVLGLRLRQRGRLAIARYTGLLVVLVAVGILSVSLFASNTSVATLERMDPLVAGSLGGSARVRLFMYEQALQVWYSHPVFGAGIGSWPMLTGWGDIEMYPHNIIMEMMAEVGLVGLLLFTILIGMGFRLFLKHCDLRQEPWAMLILMLFLYAWLNAMVSYDIATNRMVFAFLGLFLASHTTTSAPQRLAFLTSQVAKR